ncbi:hypothetical protein JCGZ_03278 [Jatropha curcas]|uniref:Aminotransferase-like plant mobile domain-containing protein n=1 Tax=Jatropha curcas TaxID=180498 RepID=A0A067JD69_JATCU|nr:hypothetical protein JCGZ_03278 [Jatropha curcas]
MSQTSEILASAYTPEMETLGALPDIPTFDGELVPVSRNPLTSGTRPLQLLPLPSTEFPVRYETSRMRGFPTEVDLDKARSGGSATNTSAFWDLLDPPMRARVVAAGFGDYTAGLRRTQPRFPPAMRYALMERWNDCTHTFIFRFGEMTLTPVDYAAITGLRFTGPVPPLDARYQTATLGAQLVWSYEYRIYPGGPSGDTPVESRRIPRYLAHCHHTYASGKDPEYWRSFLNDRELSDERKTHKTAAHYRAETAAEAGAAVAPARPAGVIPGDVPFPPGMEVVLDPALGLGSGITIPADLRRAPPLPQLDPEQATHDLEIGRLRRHQSSAVSQLQAEVDRLRTRLEVEGIPLDSSEENDDGSSSDDAPLSPPPQAAASLSRRQQQSCSVSQPFLNTF